MEEDGLMVRVRMSRAVLDDIDKVVATGKYGSREELVTLAVNELLEKS